MTKESTKMAGMLSTAVLNQMAGKSPLNEILKDCICKIYIGAIPTASGGYPAADSAVSGVLAATITTGGATSNTTHKIRVTPVIGDQVGSTWSITLNGVTANFVDDSSPTVAKICTGLYNALTAISGGAIASPACTFNIPDVFGLFTLTNNSTSLDIAASAAGVSFTYSSAVTGGTGSTGSLGIAVTTAPAMGLRFEAYSDVSLGVLEKLAADTWSGVAVAAGPLGYARFVLPSDDGLASQSQVRLQLPVTTGSGTTGFVLSNATATIGENIPLTVFKITLI
jgi:hypothetical protein